MNFTKSKGARKGQAGFTLIELMIGVAISVIVMAALIEVFRSQQITFSQQSELSKAQAASRTALTQLSRDIRMAGYTGFPLGMDLLILSGADFYGAMSIKDGSTIINSLTTNPAYLSVIATDLSGSRGDAIEIRGNFTRRTARITSNINAGTTNKIPVDNSSIFGGSGFNQPGWVLIGKSGKSFSVEVHPIASVGGGSTSEVQIADGNIQNDYTTTETVFVAPLFSRVYYLDPDTDDDPDTGSLMVANYISDGTMTGVKQTQAVEFAIDVTDFQVEYSMESGVNNRITLGQNVVCDPCQLRGVTVTLWTEGDKFRDKKPLVREFSTTVKVRNIGFDASTCALATPCSWQY